MVGESTIRNQGIKKFQIPDQSFLENQASFFKWIWVEYPGLQVFCKVKFILDTSLGNHPYYF